MTSQDNRLIGVDELDALAVRKAGAQCADAISVEGQRQPTARALGMGLGARMCQDHALGGPGGDEFCSTGEQRIGGRHPVSTKRAGVGDAHVYRTTRLDSPSVNGYPRTVTQRRHR